jgi:uncharacterized protein
VAPESTRREEEGVRSTLHPGAAEALEQAARLFDAQRFFEAHELLERVWRSAGDRRDRAFWKGLTQLAVGWCHAQRGNAHGAVTLLSRAVANLERGARAGVDTAALVASARTAIGAIRARGVAPPPPSAGFPIAPAGDAGAPGR